MAAKLTFFPVGNGAMTLLELDSGRTVLIDTNIRAKADDPKDATPDVAKQLKERLKRDSQGRLYVDALLLSHPDQDHCRGMQTHFHLGAPTDFPNSSNRIFIREIWSSPMVFRRASKRHSLCDDAKAFNAEAKRRVKVFREGTPLCDGERVLILGDDQDGKTDDLTAILVKADEVFSKVNGQVDSTFSARLLAPHPKHQEETEEDISSKNHSSTILNISLASGGNADAARFLTGGDAEVAIWDRLWERHKHRPDWLTYSILETPHHCSWHTLSYDSWSEMKEKANVSESARKALSQTRNGAVVVANSAPIKDDDNDPPCIRAKREYEAIVASVNGCFFCVGEHPSEENPEPLVLEVLTAGVRKVTKPVITSAALGLGAVGKQPMPHG